MRPFSWSRNWPLSAPKPAAGGRQGSYPCVCDGVLVVGVGCADEMVIGDESFGSKLLEDGGAPVAEQLGVHACFGRRLLDLQSVLIGAGTHESVLALEQPPSLEDVGEHQRIEVANMRRCCSCKRCGLSSI